MPQIDSQLLENLTASVPGVVYQLKIQPDGSWHFLFVSKRIESLFEVTQEDAYRDVDNIIRCIIDEDRPSHRQSIDYAIQHLLPWHHEHRILTRSGALKWIHGSALPQSLPDGSSLWNGILTDITERKRIEKEVHDANQLYETLFRLSPEIVALTSEKEGRYIAVNSAHDRATGYSADELIGHTSAELGIWAVSAERQKAIELLREQGIVHNLEVNFSRRSGEQFPALLSMARINRGGEQCLISVVTDITERKRIEKEREQYFTFFCSSDDLMVIADPNGCFKKINPACVKLLGYSEDELQSKLFIDFVHPDDRQATLDEMARQIRNGYSLDFENRYVCKDGSFRYLSWHARFVAEEGITYATARDITERKRAEEEIHRLNRLYAILSNVNLLLIKARSPEELFQQTCQIAVEQGGFLLAWIGVEDPQTSMVTLVAQAGEAQDYMHNLHISTEDRPEGRGPTGISIREGRTFVCNDFLAAPWSQPWRQRGEQAGIRSCVAIPVLFDGKRYGTFSVYAAELNVFQEKELALLEEVAMSISFGLKHLEDESQRRKAELELHNSQELLRDTAEKAKMGGWGIDLRTQELSWTEQIFKIYEVGPDFKPSVSGTIDFYAPESRPVIDRAVRQAIESGEPFDLELCLITAKNNRRDVRAVGTAHCKDGRPFKVTGTFQDITEQKLAEKTLRENELFLREVQRVGHIGTYDLDIARECWKSSPELDLIFGIDNSNPRDVRAWLNLVHPDCRNGMSSHFAASLAARQWFDMEYKIVRPSDGEERWVYGTGEFSFDTDGNPVHMIGTIQDVTERKLIEERLVKSEEKFRSIMALSPDIISIIDEHGVLAYNSPAALAIHGYAAEEMAGKNTFELIHPDDQAHVTAAFNGLLMSPSEFVTVQYRYRNKDGSYTWMEATASNQLNNPRINGVVSISRNIADRKELEEQRLELERRLLQTQKLESLGVLAGGIAHDFNNILTGIMGNISFAKMTIDGSHKAYDILARAEKASQRAADLAKQLVVFAKGGQPVKSRFVLQQVVCETIALALAGTNVKAVIDFPEPLHTVEADEGQISQSLHNIIINAVHAMPGGGKLTINGENIVLSANNSIGLPGGNYVKLSIADEGCGIAEDDQKKIFDPYFSTKAGGTGLGLASAYAIINNHHGKISVSSTVGAGTTFTIYLPSLGKIHQNKSSDTVESITSQGACSILVMDDEEVIREMASIALEHFGHRVKTCVNGEEAISIYTSAKDAGTPFSVVIMDLTIPGGMGGVEAARRILAVDPDANLIVSSGYSADPVMSNYERYGFCAAIGKPYKAEDIIEKLNMVKQRDKAVIVGCP